MLEDSTRWSRTSSTAGGVGGDGGKLQGPPPPSIPAAPRAAQTSAVLQVPAQQLGREPSRAAAPGSARPSPPPPPTAAPRTGSTHTARPRPGSPLLAGMRANGARSPRGPALPSHPPPPSTHGGRADKGASWRPRSVVAVGGLNPGPRGWPFEQLAAARPHALPNGPHRHALPSPRSSLSRQAPQRSPQTQRKPGRSRAGDTCDITAAGAPWPLLRHPSGEVGSSRVSGREGPLSSQSASTSFPHRQLGYALTMLQELRVSETRPHNHSARSLRSD